MSDLNLAGLFRNAFEGATAAGKTQAIILLSESNKDEAISQLSETQFWQQHGHGPICPIPISFTIEGIEISIEASETLESGVQVIL